MPAAVNVIQDEQSAAATLELNTQDKQYCDSVDSDDIDNRYHRGNPVYDHQ